MTELFPEHELRGEPEPPPRLPPFDFNITLKDGTAVKVNFKYLSDSGEIPHFEFFGGISSTGYRSYFPGYRVTFASRDEVAELAMEFAEYRRVQYLKEQEKEKRKTRRNNKCH